MTADRRKAYSPPTVVMASQELTAAIPPTVPPKNAKFASQDAK